MKNLLPFLLLFLPLISFGEYNGHFIEFRIETNTQEEIIGHVYRADGYFDVDSLTNEKYLIRLLEFDYGIDHNYIQFFQHRVSYRYPSYGSDELYDVYTLIGLDSIFTEHIAQIEVVNLIPFGYLIGLLNIESIEDTVWLNSELQTSFSCGGYLCDWQLFVHESSEQTDRTIQKLKEFTQETEYRIKELEEEMKYADGEYYYQAEEELDQIMNSLDEKYWEILSGMEGEKVAIVSFCSC